MLPREPSWKKVREGTVYPGNFDILQKEGLFDSTGGGGFLLLHKLEQK